MAKPSNVPKEVISKGISVSLMKTRRDKGGFTTVNDAIALQRAEREYRLEKRKNMRLV